MKKPPRIPRQLDEVSRRRNLHKEALRDGDEDARWLARRGFTRYHSLVIPSDREIHDAEYGLAHQCSIVRKGADLYYISFKHHKIVRMHNPDVRP